MHGYGEEQSKQQCFRSFGQGYTRRFESSAQDHSAKRHFGAGTGLGGVGQEPGDGRTAEPGSDTGRLRGEDGRIVPRQAAGRPDAGLRRVAHRPLRAGPAAPRRVRFRVRRGTHTPRGARRSIHGHEDDHRGGGVPRACRHGGVRPARGHTQARCAACRLRVRRLRSPRRARDGGAPLRRAACHSRSRHALVPCRLFVHANPSAPCRPPCARAACPSLSCRRLASAIVRRIW